MHLGSDSEHADMDTGLQQIAACVSFHPFELFLQPIAPDLHLGTDNMRNLTWLGKAVARGGQVVNVTAVNSAYQKHEMPVTVPVRWLHPLFSHVVQAMLDAWRRGLRPS